MNTRMAAAAPSAAGPARPAAGGSMERYRAGQMIFSQGDPGDKAFIVYEGVVEIRRKVDGKAHVLCTVANKGLFGEMALVDGKPRSAEAVAQTDVVLVVITRDKFNEKIETCDSFLRSLIRVLAKNLRATNGLLDKSAVRTVGHGQEINQDIDELSRH